MQQGFSFYLVLLGFIFFDFAYASLTLPVQQPSYKLVLQDVGILISEEIFRRFDFFKSGFHFNSEARCTLQDIDFDTWKKLNKPFQSNMKMLDVDYLWNIKTSCVQWYDYLQVNNAADIMHNLDVAILKKELPKGTLGLFKRSIASRVFYPFGQIGIENIFYDDLNVQFADFTTYCTFLWEKVAHEKNIDGNCMNVETVLKNIYCEKNNNALIMTNKEAHINNDQSKDYLIKKIVQKNSFLDFSFVMINEKLGQEDLYYEDFLEDFLTELKNKNISFFEKALFCYTKNLTLGVLRCIFENINSIECIALGPLALTNIDHKSWNPIFWQEIQVEISFRKKSHYFLFKPIETIIVDQQSNQMLCSNIPALKKEYYVYKIRALKQAALKILCVDIIVYWLARHHFILTGISGVVSGVCVMPTLVNNYMTIFDPQFGSNAQCVAGYLFKRHTGTKIILPFFLLYGLVVKNRLFQGFKYWDRIKNSIFNLFLLMIIVDYMYYFYTLYQTGSDESALYDWVYINLLVCAVGSAAGNMIIKHEKIACDFEKLWRILWHTKCPQVIISE